MIQSKLDFDYKIYQQSSEHFKVHFEFSSIKKNLDLRIRGARLLESRWINAVESENSFTSDSTVCDQVSYWIRSAIKGNYSEIPLDESSFTSDFQRKTICHLTESVEQEKKLFSYQSLSRQKQISSSARAVGRALATNPFVFFRPCHWVIPTGSSIFSSLTHGERSLAFERDVGSDFEIDEVVFARKLRAELGGYQGGLQLKRTLLDLQGKN